VLAYAPTMDRAVQEFRFRSGAKNTYWIDQLVKYVKAQGLWDAFRLYPFMDRTNAGTGATAYGLGGLTSNEMTLVNGPTWGADGVSLDRDSDQYATVEIDGLQNLQNWFTFMRVSPSDASTADGGDNSFYGFGETADNRVTGWTAVNAAAISGEHIMLVYKDTTLNHRIGSSTFTWSADEDFTMSSSLSESGTALYKNKSGNLANLLQSGITLATDTSPESTGYTSNDRMWIGTYSAATPTFDGKMKAVATMNVVPTTTQRETITDLINAL
jgi:hypothetical protein